MRSIFENIKGDRLIWAIVALLSILSFLPVYSASSDLAYDRGEGNTLVFVVMHFIELFLAFGIMYGVHRIRYQLISGIYLIMMIVVLVVLVITMMQGTVVGGASASRRRQIPIVGVSF